MTTNVLEAQTRTKQEVVAQSTITGDRARRKANGYLTKHVSMFFGAENPVFLPLERPIWQVSVIFLRYHLGPVPLAFLDVDAITGEVIPFTDNQIQELRRRAHAFVKCHSLHPTPSS